MLSCNKQHSHEPMTCEPVEIPTYGYGTMSSFRLHTTQKRTFPMSFSNDHDFPIQFDVSFPQLPEGIKIEIAQPSFSLTATRDYYNLVTVTATTTSWAPALGGSTTFNGTLVVVSTPLSATLAIQGSVANLNWTGGVAPYRVQRATDLASGNWLDVLTDAVPPVTVPLEGRAEFYRIVGQ